MSLQEINYKRYVSNMRKKLKNNSVSIISNNCIGGILYHDLGIKFNSPTINTLIYGDEYIDFIKNLKAYISCELEYDTSSKDYPIGTLGFKNGKTIHIHFLHDKSFEEAKTKWDRRKERIDYDNLFIIYEHFNKFDDDIVYEFDKLDQSKVVFTHKNFKQIKSANYISACKNETSFGTITKFKNIFSGKRNIYKYNIIKQINNIK